MRNQHKTLCLLPILYPVTTSGACSSPDRGRMAPSAGVLCHCWWWWPVQVARVSPARQRRTYSKGDLIPQLKDLAAIRIIPVVQILVGAHTATCWDLPSSDLAWWFEPAPLQGMTWWLWHLWGTFLKHPYLRGMAPWLQDPWRGPWVWSPQPSHPAHRPQALLPSVALSLQDRY